MYSYRSLTRITNSPHRHFRAATYLECYKADLRPRTRSKLSWKPCTACILFKIAEIDLIFLQTSTVWTSQLNLSRVFQIFPRLDWERRFNEPFIEARTAFRPMCFHLTSFANRRAKLLSRCDSPGFIRILISFSSLLFLFTSIGLVELDWAGFGMFVLLSSCLLTQPDHLEFVDDLRWAADVALSVPYNYDGQHLSCIVTHTSLGCHRW